MAGAKNKLGSPKLWIVLGVLYVVVLTLTLSVMGVIDLSRVTDIFSRGDGEELITETTPTATPVVSEETKTVDFSAVEEQTDDEPELDVEPADAEEEEPAEEESDRAGLERVARIYQAMDPQEAARIIEELSEDEAVEILKVMRENAAADILASMEASKAARISRKLSL